jgi:hypothetical protein
MYNNDECPVYLISSIIGLSDYYVSYPWNIASVPGILV